MTFRYDEIAAALRLAYSTKVQARAERADAPFKRTEREAFLAQLRAHDAERLLEIGAGTGNHGAAFQASGLQVVCSDLTPEMAAHCASIGLPAFAADFLHLGVRPASMDAVFAMNCLLHVPRADLSLVVSRIAEVLRPGGLLYVGQYGGFDREAIFPDDGYEPKRFFSYLSDESLRGLLEPWFELIEERSIELRPGDTFHSATGRARG